MTNFAIPAESLASLIRGRNHLQAIAKKVLLCFPETIPEGQAEISFNIPRYIIDELRAVVKETEA